MFSFQKLVTSSYAKGCQISETLIKSSQRSKNFQRQISRQSIGIIGVPFDKGQKRIGVGEGPNVLRSHGLLDQLRQSYCEVTDYGDIRYEPIKLTSEVKNMHYLDHVAACSQQVSEQVRTVMNSGRTVLTIGGDHSVAIGTIDGHIRAKKDVSVIWIDAHADLNTSETSPTGSVHGMSLGLLCKELVDYWPYLPGMDWQWPQISTKNLAYIGLRDIDDLERVIIDKFNIAAYGMEEVQRLGISEVLRQAIHKADPLHNRSIHLSFDIDALDPIEAPSTGTPVRGGLLLREGIQIVEECFRTKRLAAMDLVEFNPIIGTERDVRNTALAGVLLCKAMSGYSRSGALPLIPSEIPLPSENDTSKGCHPMKLKQSDS